jgi:GntR family transcriptional repressor for pyruvate dehydrogenase complex
MIKGEDFSPGDKFYSENELTKLLSVSRSSVREAVRLLELSGLVSVIHGKGIFIADPNEKNNQKFADWLRKNEASLEEHFEIRLIIDPKAAAYAAAKADEDDIMKLQDICRQFTLYSESGNTAEIIRLDEKFHLHLARAAKNRTLYMLMKTMTQSLPVGWISSLQVPGRIKKTIKEHCAIVDAVSFHDSRMAEKKMEEHLENALNDIRAHIAETGGAN